MTALTQLDPMGEQALIAHIAFLIGIFGSVASFFTFVFFFAKELVAGYTAGTRAFAASLRRGVLVGLFALGAVLLQLMGLIGLLELILWALFLSLVEYISSQ